MALSAEEIQQVVEALKAQGPPEPSPEDQEKQAAQDLQRQAGSPDVDPQAGPTYYVHLANGDVIESKDSGATHVEVNGETVDVIGRYQKHEV